MKRQIVLAPVLLLVIVSCCSCPRPDPPKPEPPVEPAHSEFVRQVADNAGVIVFVHGVMGDPRGTWTNPDTGAYWPALLKDDHDFDGYDIFVASYSSPALGRSYNLNELAEDLRSVFDSHGIGKYHDIVIIAHSMGGVVTRIFLTKYREYAQKIEFLHFFSTPSFGSETASIAALVSNNPQFAGLKPIDPVGDDYLSTIRRDWLAANLQKIPSYAAYEKLPTFGQIIVEYNGATDLSNQRVDPILANHIDIVKPRDPDAKPYVVFKAAFMEMKEARRNKVVIGLPNGLSLRQAIRLIVVSDGSTVDYQGDCDESVLAARVEGGQLTGATKADLIRQLPNRLVESQREIELGVHRNEERGLYEITCKH